MTKGLFIEPPMTEAEAAARVTPGFLCYLKS